MCGGPVGRQRGATKLKPVEMTEGVTVDATTRLPPGIERRRRLSVVWELLACALQGHELVGTDVAQLRPEDALVVREHDGLRWYRCLRCDSWLPLPPPVAPARDHLPPREQIAVPLRGRPLRDRFVLRLIAVDRFLHFLVIGALAAGILIFAHDRARLRASWDRILYQLQGGVGGPISDTRHGWLHEIDRLFTVATGTLILYGLAIAAYALVNLVEAIGLWIGRRWAEYLAVVEVLVFVPIEVHELVLRVSVLKILALVVNLAIAAYLLVAHRLFGIRGGGRAYRAERARDTGWPALVRSAPASDQHPPRAI
jgi:uncharacterized membrane protein (DUF2068 family)